MTTTYKWAQNFNNADSLALFNPQPRTPGELYAVRNNTTSQLAYDDAEYTELIFEALTVAEFNALNTVLGLSRTVHFAKGTGRLRNDDGTYYNANCIVQYPFSQQDKRRALAYWDTVTYPVIVVQRL